MTRVKELYRDEMNRISGKEIPKGELIDDARRSKRNLSPLLTKAYEMTEENDSS